MSGALVGSVMEFPAFVGVKVKIFGALYLKTLQFFAIIPISRWVSFYCIVSFKDLFPNMKPFIMLTLNGKNYDMLLALE